MLSMMDVPLENRVGIHQFDITFLVEDRVIARFSKHGNEFYKENADILLKERSQECAVYVKFDEHIIGDRKWKKCPMEFQYLGAEQEPEYYFAWALDDGTLWFRLFFHGGILDTREKRSSRCSLKISTMEWADNEVVDQENIEWGTKGKSRKTAKALLEIFDNQAD